MVSDIERHGYGFGRDRFGLCQSALKYLCDTLLRASLVHFSVMFSRGSSSFSSFRTLT